MRSDDNVAGSIKRRHLIQAIGAAGAAGLAGCGGGGGDGDGGGDGSGDGDDELGERVPSVIVEYWSDIGNSSRTMEQSIQQISEDYEEIGIELDIRPTEQTTNIGNAVGDGRTHHITYWTHSSAPDRLDPDELIGQFSADKAGADGGNPSNYANCEYTHPALEQASATSQDERRELVNEALEIGAEDAFVSHVHPRVTVAVYRPDRMEANGIGTAGMDHLTNPHILLESRPVDGDTITTRQNPQIIETTNFLTTISPTVSITWSNLIHSPLVEYNEEFELENVLADTIEEGNDGTQYVVELHDASFHNDDPVTAEDVKFTFELLDENRNDYPISVPQPYDSIDVVDDRTVEFNLTEPSPAIYGNTFSRWGILHQPTWEGARDSPIDFQPDPVIGSGPFEMTDYQIGEFIRLGPASQEHPVYNPDHNVLLQVFADQQAQNQAFINGDLDFVSAISPASLEDMERQLGDDMEVVETAEFVGFYLFPQYSTAPSKFKPFRQAIDMSYSRQRIHDTVFRGGGFIQFGPSVFTETHPWYPDDGLPTHTEDPQGDVDGARDVLRDAGWGWDGDGNLHYPPDADLSPLWPEGENPTDEDGFACLDGEGEYVPQD